MHSILTQMTSMHVGQTTPNFNDSKADDKPTDDQGLVLATGQTISFAPTLPVFSQSLKQTSTTNKISLSKPKVDNCSHRNMFIDDLYCLANTKNTVRTSRAPRKEQDPEEDKSREDVNHDTKPRQNSHQCKKRRRRRLYFSDSDWNYSGKYLNTELYYNSRT